MNPPIWLLILVGLIALSGCDDRESDFTGEKVRINGTDVCGVVEGRPYAFSDDWTVVYADKEGRVKRVYVRESLLVIIRDKRVEAK